MKFNTKPDNWGNSIKNLIIGLIFTFFIGTSPVYGDIPFEMKQSLKNAEMMALKWLKSQIVPNEVVKLPAPGRRKLILSYELPPEDPLYKYIAPRSFTYDNAVAIVAFVMAGELRSAEAIINTLWRLQRDDGSFYVGYNTHNSWPNEKDDEGALVRTGALAWVGFSTVYYLRTMIEKNPDFIKTDIIGKRAFEISKKLADYIIKHQVNDKNSPLYGLVTGGYGEYILKIKDGKLQEQFDRSPLDWASTEHNIDTYFFLRDFGRLTGDKKYIESAKKIEIGVLKLWADKYNQFFRGIKADGEIDRALPLDCSSWAGMYVKAIGKTELLNKILSSIDKQYRVSSENFYGYRPYAKGPIYEDPEVNQFFKQKIGFSRWEKSDIIWIEGNLGVASTFYKAGNQKKALEILKSSMNFQKNGGFIYANRNIPYQFNTYPSVASTGWFIITVEIMKNENKNRSFWDR